MKDAIRKIKKGLKNSLYLLKGYNIYVDGEKFDLIKNVFNDYLPEDSTFADLGGVWKVNAAYTIYTLKNFNIRKGYIVDTDFNEKTDHVLSGYDNLIKVKANFSSDEIISQIDAVDVIYLFDVLLHQVAPNWDDVLEKYSKISKCFAIYNQQYNKSQNTIRLTDLSLEEYKQIAPQREDGLYDFIYNNKNKINSKYEKPWKDVHNIWQWGITDNDLRSKMKSLGFTEKYYKNCGQFSNLEFFENHAFIFLRE